MFSSSCMFWVCSMFFMHRVAICIYNILTYQKKKKTNATFCRALDSFNFYRFHSNSSFQKKHTLLFSLSLYILLLFSASRCTLFCTIITLTLLLHKIFAHFAEILRIKQSVKTSPKTKGQILSLIQ